MPSVPQKAKDTTPKEFLVISLPDDVQSGATLRLLDVKGTQAAAEKVVAELDSGTLGRVAVVERKALFMRRAAVESVEIENAISPARARGD